MNHSFDVAVAQQVGVEAAILFANIEHWEDVNRKNGNNLKNGLHWVYNSRAAWCAIFPYLGEKQIRNALERLLEVQLVQRDTFSFGSVNRTYWYTLGERAKPCGPKGPNLGSDQKAKPITVVNTDINSTTISQEKTKAPAHANNRGQRLEAYLAPFITGDVSMPPEFFDFVAALGWDDVRIWRVWDTFRDYWRAKAGQGGVKLDWLATWRNWCRNEKQPQRGNGYSAPSKSVAVGNAVLAELMDKERMADAAAGADSNGGAWGAIGSGEGR